MAESSLFGQILAGGATGVIATLLLVLGMILTEKLVVGKVHERERARADRFEKATLNLLRVAARATDAMIGTATGAGDADD